MIVKNNPLLLLLIIELQNPIKSDLSVIVVFMLKKENHFLVFSGMQRYAAVILFIGFYFIGLPSSYLFMFVIHLDIYGFWLGVISAEILINIALLTLIWRFDWYKCSEEAQDHIRFAVSSIHSIADSPALNNKDGHMKLFPYTSDRKNDEQINDHGIVPIQSDKAEPDSNERGSDESLLKLIGIKLLVFICFSCAFIISFINSIK
jgi:hypothetical protein